MGKVKVQGYVVSNKKLYLAILMAILTYWFLHPSSAHFLRNIDICSNSYFFKSI